MGRQGYRWIRKQTKYCPLVVGKDCERAVNVCETGAYSGEYAKMKFNEEIYAKMPRIQAKLSSLFL